MIEYNDEYGAYVLEFDDVIVCWDEEPDENGEQLAEEVRNAYLGNIRHIAAVIFDEIKDIFPVSDIDDVIAKLGRPQIDPDNGQVSYCENQFDDMHTISFEYTDDEFNEIEYVSVDG